MCRVGFIVVHTVQKIRFANAGVACLLIEVEGGIARMVRLMPCRVVSQALPTGPPWIIQIMVSSVQFYLYTTRHIYIGTDTNTDINMGTSEYAL